MADLGVDYSFARPDLGSLRSQGYVFVARYLCPEADGDKLVGPAEAQAIFAAGWQLVLVYEDGAENAAGGAAQGTIDGQRAAAAAGALGWPSWRPIYAACDWDVAVAQYPTVAAYLAAFEGASGHPVGIYGPVALVDWCISNGHAAWGWQAGGWNPTGVTSQFGHLCQRVGSAPPGCDVDVALKADFGGWDGHTAPPAPPAPPTPSPWQIGNTVTVIPIEGTTDVNGWFCLGVNLPAGKTKDDVCGIVMDAASAFDPQSWTWCQATVDYEGSTAGYCRIVFHGDPSSFFTGRVFVAG